MIFVTVGTHEQQFDRLIREVDKLVQEGIIKEKVFIQSGYSTYKPEHCDYSELISYEEMNDYAEQARIIITHGGPGSIFLAFEKKKTPIVVPRLSEYNEHVDNHQLYFSEMLLKKDKIILIKDIKELANILENYIEGEKNEQTTFEINRKKFINNLKQEIDLLII